MQGRTTQNYIWQERLKTLHQIDILDVIFENFAARAETVRFVQDSDNKMEETEKKTISNGYARKNDKHKSGASIPYLVLKVQDSQYAIDVAAVQSIIWLP